MASGRRDSGGQDRPGDSELSLEKLVEGRRKGGHFIESVLEEIALEGLDGITFQGLKVRLEERGDLEVEDFEVIAPSVWNQLKRCKNVEFYVLPRTRPDLIKYKWLDFKDDRGTYFEPNYAPEEIYHYNPIEDKGTGIRGSCQDYNTRRDITHVARQSSYVQIMQGLGNRFVIVATQPVREQALLGTNYKLHKSLSIVQYCIMERVGRARSSGEVTRGKISSSCLNIPPKTLFYMRKHLIKAGLVLKQSVSIKFGSGKCPAGVTVFHLPRFFQKIESTGSINTRIVFTWLMSSPTKSVPVEKVVSKFGKHTLRGIVLDFKNIVCTKWEDKAAPSDPNEDGEDAPKKKNPRVLFLKENDMEVVNRALSKTSTDHTGEEEDGGGVVDPQEDEISVNVSSPTSYSEVQVLRPHKQLLFDTTCVQILYGMMRAGVGGLTLYDIRNLVNMTPLESRSCSRFLTRHKFCTESMIKLHKQKAFTYSLVCFQGLGLEGDLGMQEKLMVAVQEKERIQGLLEKREERERARRIKTLKRKQKRLMELKPVVPEPVPDQKPSEEAPVEQKVAKKAKSKTAKNVPVLVELSSDFRVSPKKTNPPIVTEPVVDEFPSALQEDEAPTTLEPEVVCPPSSEITTEGTTSEEFLEENVPSPQDNYDYGDIDVSDPVDEMIRKNLTRQRVAWSPVEDRYVLVSFIASALFIPRYPFDRLFMYNADQVRNILWEKSNGKSDKTCGAIRRRLHFLLRQKRPYEWYTQHLEDAFRDHFLYQTYFEKVVPPPQVKIYWTPPEEALMQVVDYLIDKFGAEGGVVSEPSVTPATKTSSGLDTLLFLRQLKRAEPFWNGLRFVMCLKMGTTQCGRRQFRCNWRDKYGLEGTSQREDMFTEYCWRYLRFLAKNLTITFNNIIVLGYLSSKLFQIVHFKSVMASASTSNLYLSRRECSGHPEVKQWTARCILLEQFFSGGGEISGLRGMSDMPIEKGAQLLQRSRILVTVKESRLLRLNKKVIKNFAAGLPFSAYGEIWELMRYLDENSRVDALACHSVGLVTAVIETTDYWNTRITLPKMLFKLKKNLGGNTDVASPDDDDQGVYVPDQNISQGKRRHSSESEPGRKRKKKKGDDKVVRKVAQSLSSLSVSDDDKREEKKIDPNKNITKPTPGKVGLEAGENFKSSRIDHNAMQLLRVRLNPSALTAFEEDEEAVSINFPGLEFQFGKTMTEMNKSCVGTKEPFSLDRLKELRKALVELAYHRVPSDATDAEASTKYPGLSKYLNKFSPLFDLINMMGPAGVSGAYLKKVFQRNYLLAGLRHLLESKLIFSLGVTTRRFVSFNNANNWLIPIRNPLENRKIVGNVVMRPWVTTIGGISWSTINRLFAALVGQLHKPAILLTEMCQLFEPVLSHVESLVLIEALTKVKYLTLYKLDEPKVTLFSKHQKDKSRIVYYPETLLETDNIYVATSPYVSLLHSQLNHSIQRHCKKKPIYSHNS